MTSGAERGATRYRPVHFACFGKRGADRAVNNQASRETGLVVCVISDDEPRDAVGHSDAQRLASVDGSQAPCRSGLGREAVTGATLDLGLALHFHCLGIRFRPYGESLLAVAPKGTKRSCPSIRVSLRSTSLTPSLLRGPAAKGHPWPIAALAASMPLNPLHNDCVRPAGKGRCPGSNLLFRRGKVLAFVSNDRSHAEHGNDQMPIGSHRPMVRRLPVGAALAAKW